MGDVDPKTVLAQALMQPAPQPQLAQPAQPAVMSSPTPMPAPIRDQVVDPSWYRADGSRKGNGFLGSLPRPDGKVSSELSIGVNIDGREIEIPSMVPTLSQQEIDHLLNGGQMTDAIVQKAVDHARMRMQQGLPVFK